MNSRKPSTRALGVLAAPTVLARIGQSAAMLDAILFPDDWDMRFYSFDAHWGRGERVFSMRNGEGDFYFLWLAKAGAVLHGFAHESPMSPWSSRRAREGEPKEFPGLRAGFPKALAYSKTAAAFCEDPLEITFLAWWTGKNGPWCIGDVAFPSHADPDGSRGLLGVLDGRCETYAKWARIYAEKKIPLGVVKKIYAGAPLTKELVASLNGEATLADVRKEAKSTGYPP